MADASYSIEEWRDIPEWEGLYQASSLGRIRSVPRTKRHKTKLGEWYEMPLKGRVLRDARGAHGYRVVVLCDLRTGRKPRMFRVHRLVCLTFHANTEAKLEVAHNDGVKHNNAANNLRWATRAENLADIKVHRGQAASLG